MVRPVGGRPLKEPVLVPRMIHSAEIKLPDSVTLTISKLRSGKAAQRAWA